MSRLEDCKELVAVWEAVDRLRRGLCPHCGRPVRTRVTGACGLEWRCTCPRREDMWYGGHGRLVWMGGMPIIVDSGYPEHIEAQIQLYQRAMQHLQGQALLQAIHDSAERAMRETHVYESREVRIPVASCD
jgi:hypothetical protein